jgi:hypothetical protein
MRDLHNDLFVPARESLPSTWRQLPTNSIRKLGVPEACHVAHRSPAPFSLHPTVNGVHSLDLAASYGGVNFVDVKNERGKTIIVL